MSKRSERSVQLEMAHKVRACERDDCSFELSPRITSTPHHFQAVVGQLSLEYDLKPIPRPASEDDDPTVPAPVQQRSAA